ncbi:MAG: hypothetical protein M3133_00325 [Actinomycetota bacterium]|nr:hypothetical protein [Actinomycetota bacterium]
MPASASPAPSCSATRRCCSAGLGGSRTNLRSLRWRWASRGDAVYFGSLEHDGRLLAAALRTPPRNFVLSDVDDPAALPLLAEDVVAFHPPLPALLGPLSEAATFAELWQGGRVDQLLRLPRSGF